MATPEAAVAVLSTARLVKLLGMSPPGVGWRKLRDSARLSQDYWGFPRHFRRTNRKSGGTNIGVSGADHAEERFGERTPRVCQRFEDREMVGAVARPPMARE